MVVVYFLKNLTCVFEQSSESNTIVSKKAEIVVMVVTFFNKIGKEMKLLCENVRQIFFLHRYCITLGRAS